MPDEVRRDRDAESCRGVSEGVPKSCPRHDRVDERGGVDGRLEAAHVEGVEPIGDGVEELFFRIELNGIAYGK